MLVHQAEALVVEVEQAVLQLRLVVGRHEGQRVAQRVLDREMLLQRDLALHAAFTGFESTPMPLTSTSIVSPAFMNTLGLRPKPTPLGEPVVMQSPGWKR